MFNIFLFKLSPQVFLHLFSPKNDSVLARDGRLVYEVMVTVSAIVYWKSSAPHRSTAYSFSAQCSMVSELQLASLRLDVFRGARVLYKLTLLIVNVKICVVYLL